jgi:hypothetical protein
MGTIPSTIIRGSRPRRRSWLAQPGFRSRSRSRSRPRSRLPGRAPVVCCGRCRPSPTTPRSSRSSTGRTARSRPSASTLDRRGGSGGDAPRARTTYGRGESSRGRSRAQRVVEVPEGARSRVEHDDPVAGQPRGGLPVLRRSACVGGEQPRRDRRLRASAEPSRALPLLCHLGCGLHGEGPVEPPIELCRTA